MEILWKGLRLMVPGQYTSPSMTSGNPGISSKSIEKSELADIETGDNSTNAVKMFPNPTTGTMTLSLDGINDAVVRIVDMNGKEISKEKLANSTKEYTIELNNQGMYVVEIQEEGSQTWSGKVSVI